MKALTLIQPWATAITHAGKRIENRTWAPPRYLLDGEKLCIHAGKKLDFTVLTDLGIDKANASGQLMQLAALLAQPDHLRLIRDTSALLAMVESGDFDCDLDYLNSLIQDNLRLLGAA